MKLIVLTDRQTSLGFRLAGAHVVETSIEDAEIEVRKIVEDSDCGTLIINENMYEHLSEKLKKRMESRGLPVVIPVPVPVQWKGGTTENYIVKLIRRAIGYQIKVKGSS